MKVNIKRILALLLSVMFVFLMGLTALAVDVPDEDRLCSVTLVMNYRGDPVGGGSLSIYRVGEVVEDDGNYSFAPTGDFADCGETFNDLEDAELAVRLKRFAERNSIAAVSTRKIGSDGKVSFDKLPIGLYMIVQNQAAPGFKNIAPFLISLPYMEDGKYQYDLLAEPKTELEPKPDEDPDPTPETPPAPEDDPKPSVPDEPKLPQTGQLWWPVPMLICVGLILVLVGIVLSRRKEIDER